MTAACSKRTRAGRALLVGAVAAPVVLGLGVGPAAAGEGQFGAPMALANSAGGAAADGSDGLALAFNADPGYAVTAGQDQINHRGGAVYEGEGAGPVLNVGGVMIGQAGPAAFNASQDWDLVQVTSYSGGGAQVVAPGSYTPAMTTLAGDASFEIDYQATVGGLTYTVTRDVSYDGTSDRYNEAYVVNIPAGNTAPVSLYSGGNVAPDGTPADTYGFYIDGTGPETFGERTADGTYLAYRSLPTPTNTSGDFTSFSAQTFDTDYPAVGAGTALSDTVDTTAHDGGLLAHWDLGSTPGNQQRELVVFAGQAQAKITGAFTDATVAAGDTTDYVITIDSGSAPFIPGAGLDFTVPSGATLGTSTSDCFGTVSSPVGSPTVSLSDVTLDLPGTSCTLTVSMTFAAAGTATVDATNVTNLAAAANQVASDSITVTDGTVVVPPGPGPVTPPVTGTDPVSVPGGTGTVPGATGTTPVTPASLATTGVETGPIVALGAGLLAAGAGAVLAGRRRKATAN